MGAACDTAQRSTPDSGSTARFSTDRQKFCVAFFSSPAFHPESTLTAPLIVTSSGFLPSPATDV